jgi:epoxyqueuosine reductase QueG
LKEKITSLIKEYIKEYEQDDSLSTNWGEPLVGFADAAHPYILNLKNVITPSHALPTDVLKDASIVIVYYVPFTKELAQTNKISSDIASEQWAIAYEETNAMFIKLNDYLILKLKEYGYHAGFSKEALTFDKTIFKSNWSHRHFAYAAGLGTFGINNMLITKSGCCGRYSSIVTNLNITPTTPMTEELCLYKKNKSCKACIKHCPSGALTTESFNREKCYEVLMKNAAIYTNFGSSYIDEQTGCPNSIGSDVCGKCITNSPCAFWNEQTR